MQSRRALLCIHFYGLESDFLLAQAHGGQGGWRIHRDAETTEIGIGWTSKEDDPELNYLGLVLPFLYFVPFVQHHSFIKIGETI